MAMNDSTNVSLSTHASVHPARWLLAGTLVAAALPALASEAVATAKKASTPVADKVAPKIKTMQKTVSDGDKGSTKELHGPVPPKHPSEKAKKPIKSNEKAKSIKALPATNKDLMSLENAATKK
jgi:hypothetical protein